MMLMDSNDVKRALRKTRISPFLHRALAIRVTAVYRTVLYSTKE